MSDQAQNRPELLSAMVAAFAKGDLAHAEQLFGRALDDGIPWDVVTSEAAKGHALRYQRPTGEQRAS